MKFRVTYWPGTADLFRKSCPCCDCCITSDNSKNVPALMDRIEKVVHMEFASMKDALNGTAARWISVSDGVLIEYVKECATCDETFYTRDDAHTECEECALVRGLA